MPGQAVDRDTPCHLLSVSVIEFRSDQAHELLVDVSEMQVDHEIGKILYRVSDDELVEIAKDDLLLTGEQLFTMKVPVDGAKRDRRGLRCDPFKFIT